MEEAADFKTIRVEMNYRNSPAKKAAPIEVRKNGFGFSSGPRQTVDNSITKDGQEAARQKDIR
jgi:hypothetical protein